MEIFSCAAMIVAGLVVGWASGWFVARIPKEGSDALGVYIRRQFRLTWRMIPKLVFLAVLIWPLKIYLFSRMGEFSQTSYAWYATVLVAPIIEEVVFRGIIFQALRERYHLLVGLVLSAALFAAGHDVASISQLLPFFLSGVGYAVIYAWTGSLVPAMLMHGGWNAFVLVLALVL